jgi:hypothetical protein
VGYRFLKEFPEKGNALKDLVQLPAAILVQPTTCNLQPATCNLQLAT